MYVSDGKFTHYLYYTLANGMREPTGLLCLSIAGPKTRKAVLHNAMKNSEQLAILPAGVSTMKQLRDHLKGLGK